jgi:hypothetical protein
MADLELTANNPTFTPVDVNAHDPLPHPELIRRVTEAMAKTHDANWNLKNSENHRDWNPADDRARMKSARQAAIRAWNEEQMAKAMGAPASE